MKTEPETAAAMLIDLAASPGPQEQALEKIEERARVAGRHLSRSWLLRLGAVAAGLIAAELARRRRAAHRASAR